MVGASVHIADATAGFKALDGVMDTAEVVGEDWDGPLIGRKRNDMDAYLDSSQASSRQKSGQEVTDTISNIQSPNPSVPEVWCFCQQIQETWVNEPAIGCANDECDWKWFHHSCLMTHFIINQSAIKKWEQLEHWYCPYCLLAKTKKRDTL